ncbi:hypothetical protein AVEN_84640-1 [Araneus ventricosus]|uniref:Uncharacterized protein n=1 Tax=Araneus ventricosus TaxID=182803 RepID=A0A4Y2S5I6_ARAVE|nr:hypothetical protein AVEN_246197-1 [Araneus ventricosus]GBN83153.1 hypothetical protein AVEN_84640-1 [Araneus ventricosus]
MHNTSYQAKLRYQNLSSAFQILAGWMDNHKKPCEGIRENLNDLPPRHHRSLWPRLITPLRETHTTIPVLPAYDPSSEMGPKSHTTLNTPTLRGKITREISRTSFWGQDKVT